MMNSNEYLLRINNDNILRLFYLFIYNKTLNIDLIDFQNQTDKELALFVKALVLNRKGDFVNLYNIFSQKRPSLTAPWVNNDYLIFVLIVGICQFDISKDWIIKVLNTRSTQETLQQQINITFKNIVLNNLRSNENLFGIVIVYQKLTCQPLSYDEMNELYIKITNDNVLFEKKHDFLICISMRALEIIICSKGFVDTTGNDNLVKFSKVFLRRTYVIGTIAYFLIVFGIFSFAILFYLNNEYAFNAVSSIFSLLGIGVIGTIKYIKSYLIDGIRYVLGYGTLIKK